LIHICVLKKLKNNSPIIKGKVNFPLKKEFTKKIIKNKNDMERRFLNELDELKVAINKMALLVNEQVESSFNILEDGTTEIVKIKQKDREIDALDNLVIAKCENLLALFQPVAGDLRFILSALKVGNQLERCGDIAVNIVQRINKIDHFSELVSDIEIFEMANVARIMVKDAITAFINQDTKLAEATYAKDDIVDEYNKRIFKQIIDKIKKNPENTEPYAHLIVLLRHIERLADHATNITEDVIFLTQNEIVTHKKKLQNFHLPEQD